MNTGNLITIRKAISNENYKVNVKLNGKLRILNRNESSLQFSFIIKLDYTF